VSQEGQYGHILAVAGRREEALKVATGLIGRYDQGVDGAAAGVAAIYAGLNDTDRAFEWLDRARKLRDPALASLTVDATYDGLRADPRFAKLAASLGFTGK
jgi:hypothetical protein